MTSPPLRIAHSSALWTHKRGNEAAEWEDSFAISERNGVAAVADGASASVRAGLWASVLAGGLLDDPTPVRDPSSTSQWLDRQRLRFAGHVDEPGGGDDVAWYADAAAQRASYATLVAAAVGRDTCHLLAVGDSCGFVVRAASLLVAWPVSRAADFDAHPDLLSSDPDSRFDPATARHADIPVRSGDTVFLASDAVAQWALSVHEHEPDLWRVLATITPDGFDQLVGDLDASGDIVNDDIALVRLHLGTPGAST